MQWWIWLIGNAWTETAVTVCCASGECDAPRRVVGDSKKAEAESLVASYRFLRYSYQSFCLGDARISGDARKQNSFPITYAM